LGPCPHRLAESPSFRILEPTISDFSFLLLKLAQLQLPAMSRHLAGCVLRHNHVFSIHRMHGISGLEFAGAIAPFVNIISCALRGYLRAVRLTVTKYCYSREWKYSAQLSLSPNSRPVGDPVVPG